MAPEVLVYDVIAPTSLRPFLDEVATAGNAPEVVVRINSPGGHTPTARAMFVALEGLRARTGAKLTGYVDGLAASSASYLAMAVDRLVMPDNALMMIHNPAVEAQGTPGELRKVAEALDRERDMMAVAYARRCGKSLERVRELMQAETWFTAAEAVEQGFAHEVAAPVKMAASTLKNLPFKVPTNIADFATNYWANRNRGQRPPPISAAGIWERWNGGAN